MKHKNKTPSLSVLCKNYARPLPEYKTQFSDKMIRDSEKELRKVGFTFVFTLEQFEELKKLCIGYTIKVKENSTGFTVLVEKGEK